MVQVNGLPPNQKTQHSVIHPGNSLQQSSQEPSFNIPEPHFPHP